MARAEGLPFPADVFDAVIFVVSLQFVEDYREAVGQAARVLKPEGTLVALLLNPASDYFRKRRRDPGFLRAWGSGTRTWDRSRAPSPGISGSGRSTSSG